MGARVCVFGWVRVCVCEWGRIYVRVWACVCVCVCVCVGVLVICTPTEVFLALTEVYMRFLLSCKANARVKFAKTGHGPHSSKLVICVVLWLFVFYVLSMCKCVL